MANEQEFDVSLEPTIYFYVNKESGSVELASMYTIFGITVRHKGKDWEVGTRDMLADYYSAKYEIWSYDWDNEDDTPSSGSHMDPADELEWEIELIQNWANGKELSRDDISDTCKLVNSGEYVSPEDVEDIPGE